VAPSAANVASDRLGVVGFSRGGEAALLVGAHVDRVGAVVAYSGSGLAFPAPTWMDGVAEEGPAWTVDGEPIPYVPVDKFVETGEGLVETVEGTADTDGTGVLDHVSNARRARAAIEIENVDGPVLLVSGGVDEVWASARLSAVAVDRLDRHDHEWAVRHRPFPNVGHAIRVPYRFDDTDDPPARHVFGGTNAANARASAIAWQEALECLRQGLR
jgi:dienelactone hydrolase